MIKSHIQASKECAQLILLWLADRCKRVNNWKSYIYLAPSV